MLVLFRFVAAASLLAAAPSRADDAADLSALRQVDLRMASIAYRLTTANAALCTDRAPNAGIVVHALAQYGAGVRGVAKQVFGFEAPVAVEAVVAGSPADRAGVRANDSVVAIAGATPPAVTGDSNQVGDAGHAAMAWLNGQPLDRPLRLTLLRDGVRREVTVIATPACRSEFEVVLGGQPTSQADGVTVQLGLALFNDHDDGDIAVYAAHELAHNILRHRLRLEAAGVGTGLAREFGRNRRLTRLVEDQADLLSVHLLRNAGYDPAGAVRFWRSEANAVGDLLRSRTHGSASERARAIEAEIARIPLDAPIPYVPAVLATRDVPLGR